MNEFELNAKFREAIVSYASQQGGQERFAVPTIEVAAFIDDYENLSLQKTNTLAREHGLVVDREGDGRWHIRFTKADVERLSAHLRGEKSRDEIEALKVSWVKDPSWDLEFTEGFEAHIPELKSFRAEREAKWNVEQDETVKLTFEHRAGEIMDELDELHCQDTYANMIIAREHAKATLLLAEQVKRVADNLEDYLARKGLIDTLNLGAEKG